MFLMQMRAFLCGGVMHNYAGWSGRSLDRTRDCRTNGEAKTSCFPHLTMRLRWGLGPLLWLLAAVLPRQVRRDAGG
jgi:hypothetical protein